MSQLQATLCYFAAMFSLISASCDPPQYIEAIDVTCPSKEEAPGQALTYEDPDHCSQYYECWEGCASHLICPEGLLYDDIYGCNYPESVNCGDRDCDGLPCDTSPTQPPADFDCPTANGYYEYPDNCIKYYECVDYQAVTRVCPVASTGEQEMWCPECGGGVGWCDFPWNVDCGERPVCDEYDENCEAAPTQPPLSCAPCDCSAIPCPGSGVSYIETGGCSACFCECSNGVPYEQCCAEGLYFNPAIGVCDWDYNNPAC